MESSALASLHQTAIPEWLAESTRFWCSPLWAAGRSGIGFLWTNRAQRPVRTACAIIWSPSSLNGSCSSWLLRACGAVARLSSSFLEIVGTPFARFCGTLELPLGSGSLPGCCFGYLAQLLRHRRAGSQFVSILPASWYRTGALDRALRYRRYLRGDHLSRLPTTAVHGPDEERSRRYSSFCRSIRRGSRVPRLSDDDSDRPVRSNVRNSGLLARNRSPWNDRPCVERFTERSACQFGEALESAHCHQ